MRNFPDELADAEELIASLKARVAALEQENTELKHRNLELLALQSRPVADVAQERFHGATKFRCGPDTGERWMPFCAVCGLPAKTVQGYEHWGLVCANAPACGWHSEFPAKELESIIRSFDAEQGAAPNRAVPSS